MLRERPDGTLIDVRVVPNAAKSGVAGERNGAWLVRLAAPPVDGKANDALTAFLADRLDVPRRAVSIVRGHTARQKQVLVAGIGVDAVLGRLKGAP